MYLIMVHISLQNQTYMKGIDSLGQRLAAGVTITTSSARKGSALLRV